MRLWGVGRGRGRGRGFLGRCDMALPLLVNLGREPGGGLSWLKRELGLAGAGLGLSG